MKVNSVKQQNFTGTMSDRIAGKIAKNPKLVGGIAALAGCSVVSQKLVMSAGEATIGPAVDIGVGKAITAITGEKDGRTNQSSKIQAVRTVAQTVGGTITGIAIRMGCIAAATAACAWAGEKAGGKIADVLTKTDLETIKPEEAYKYHEHMAKWGKTVGGALATAVMMVTNFVIDAPFINWINKKLAPVFGVNLDNKADDASKEVK